MPANIVTSAKGVGLFSLAPLLMVLNLILARMLRGSVPPLTLAFARWAIAALVLWPFVGRPGWLAVRSQPIERLFALALLGGALTVGPQYVATTLTTPANVGLIFATTPLLVILFEWGIWATKVAATSIAGALIALAGVSFSALQSHLPGANHPFLGDALALCGALGWAGYTSFLRHRPVQLEPLQLLWAVASGGALLLLLPAFSEIVAGHEMTISLRIALLVIAISLVASILVYFFYGKLVAVAGPSVASTSMFLVPVYAFLEAWAFNHHGIAPTDVVGLASIILGMMMLLKNSSIAPKSME